MTIDCTTARAPGAVWVCPATRRPADLSGEAR